MTKQPQKIVALVDGSIYSSSVCEHAARIASRTGAPVELNHMLGRREASDSHDHSAAIALGARTALMEQLAEIDAQRAKLISHRGRGILDDATGLLERAGVIEVTTRLRHGDIVETVADVEGDARVILIGKRGDAAYFAKGHLGRTSNASYAPATSRSSLLREPSGPSRRCWSPMTVARPR